MPDQPTAGSTATRCERWPNEGHTTIHHSPAGTNIFIRSCTSCGWVDGADLQAQLDAERAKGWQEAIRALEDRGRYTDWRVRYGANHVSQDARVSLAAYLAVQAAEADRA